MEIDDCCSFIRVRRKYSVTSAGGEVSYGDSVGSDSGRNECIGQKGQRELQKSVQDFS